MKANDTVTIRWVVGWIAMVVGALLGWGFAELAWRHAHPHGVYTFGGPPIRGLDYWISAMLCSLTGATIGLALVRFQDLPAD